MNNSKKANEERIKVGTIVDEDGVILGGIYEGDKIVTPKQQEYTQKYITNFQKKEAFVKVFTSPIPTLFKELPTKEFAVAMAIMPFISYKDGILKYNNKIYEPRYDEKNIFNIENFNEFKKAKDKTLIIHKEEEDGTIITKEMPFKWKIINQNIVLP